MLCVGVAKPLPEAGCLNRLVVAGSPSDVSLRVYAHLTSATDAGPWREPWDYRHSELRIERRPRIWLFRPEVIHERCNVQAASSVAVCSYWNVGLSVCLWQLSRQLLL